MGNDTTPDLNPDNENIPEIGDENAPPPVTPDPSIGKDSTEALDDLVASFKAADDKPAGDKPPAEKPAADNIEVKPAAGDAKPADGKPDAAAAAAPKVADELDKVALPPYSKPKTGEAFEQVKTIARTQLAERDTQITKLNEELNKIKADLEKRLPSEAEKELEELRRFKQSVDVENDPHFVEKFDKKVSTNSELIYRKLAEAGVSAEKIEEIKKIGGPTSVDWEPILPKLPSNVKRFIESKLNENESLTEEKSLALADAKKNASKFLSERASERDATAKQDDKVALDFVNSRLPNLPWAVEKQVPSNATAEQRKAIEEHNKAAKETQGTIVDFMRDTTPENKAMLAMTAVIAMRQKQDIAARDTKIAELEKKLGETTGELEKIKKATQTSKARNTVAPSRLPAVNSSPFQDSGSALDSLRQQVESSANV